MRAFILFSLLMISSSSFGHNYYFAFAEVQYDDISQRFQATVIVSSHDLEFVLEKEGVMQLNLDKLEENSKNYTTLENYLSEHFIVETGKEKCAFKLVGFRNELSGTSSFYLESEPIELQPELKLTFDIFMKQYPQQQNKITLFYRDAQYTLPFLLNEPKQTINLENE